MTNHWREKYMLCQVELALDLLIWELDSNYKLNVVI